VVGGEPVREGEVAVPRDFLLFEVDVVDREEVGVQIIEVVEDPHHLPEPVRDRLQPGLSVQPSVEAGQPRLAFPPVPSWSPRASLMMMSTICSSWSSLSPLDCSRAM